MSANENSEGARTEIKIRHERLKKLRDLVLSDKHLNSRTDDTFLLTFLWARKYDTARAFQLIKNYYAIRKRYPEIFRNLRPSSIQKSMEAKIGGKIAMEDFLLAIGIIGRWDPDEVHFTDILRHIIMQFDYMLEEGALQDTKITAIFDVAGLNWKHFIHLTPRMVYILISSLYACYPISYSQIHIVNENRIFHAALLMMLPFLPRKLKSRIHLHGSSMESLQKFVEPKNLPADFGGELPPFDPTECDAVLRENEQFFIDNEKFWTVDNIN